MAACTRTHTRICMHVCSPEVQISLMLFNWFNLSNCCSFIVLLLLFNFICLWWQHKAKHLVQSNIKLLLLLLLSSSCWVTELHSLTLLFSDADGARRERVHDLLIGRQATKKDNGTQMMQSHSGAWPGRTRESGPSARLWMCFRTEISKQFWADPSCDFIRVILISQRLLPAAQKTPWKVTPASVITQHLTKLEQI